jgi:hypothetical protein
MKKQLLFLSLQICAFTYVSCEEIITVPDITEASVNLLAPSNNTVVENSPLSCVWDPVPEAETYKIQIAQPNFENAQQIFADSTLSSTNFIWSLDNGSYQWRVKAINSAYETAFSTNSFSIDVQD